MWLTQASNLGRPEFIQSQFGLEYYNVFQGIKWPVCSWAPRPVSILHCAQLLFLRGHIWELKPNHTE